MNLIAVLTLALGVSCYSSDLPAPVVGYAYSLPARIVVDSSYVTPYVRFGLKGTKVTSRRADAVYVVAHELGHLRSSWTEAGANRWAHRNWSLVVRLLGGTRQQARQLWLVLSDGFRNL